MLEGDKYVVLNYIYQPELPECWDVNEQPWPFRLNYIPVPFKNV